MIEFEFESTPETDAMLKQICTKECFVRCKDCKYSWTPEHPNKYYCHINYHISKDDPDGYADNEIEWAADDFCSRGERINGTRKTD